MQPIRQNLNLAAAGAVVLTAALLVIVGDRDDEPPPSVAEAEDTAPLVERVTAAIEAAPSGAGPLAAAPVETASSMPPPAILSPTEAQRIAGRAPTDDAEKLAVAVAAATRTALAAIAASAADDAPARPAIVQAETSDFRRIDDDAPDFVISATDAWLAADQGWVAASGVASATISPRPRARQD